MRLKIYSIYDSATMAYLTPFFCRSNGEAIRAFTAAANDAGHKFHQHADDYILFEIGSYDDETGTLVPLLERKSLGIASEYVNWKGTTRMTDLEAAIHESRTGEEADRGEA